MGTYYDLVQAANDAATDLEDAMDDLNALNDAIEDADNEVALNAGLHLLAVVACKVENYDKYTATW